MKLIPKQYAVLASIEPAQCFRRVSNGAIYMRVDKQNDRVVSSVRGNKSTVLVIDLELGHLADFNKDETVIPVELEGVEK